jgi:Na+/melibiose symporter-like transporter
MYAATASSDLADGIGRTALPLAAAAYTRNPVTIAGLTTFAFLPWLLLALPSGALVDRVDRRSAMAAANAVRAVTTAALAVVVLSHAGGIVLLYTAAFLLGAAETVYDSAVRALLPRVVEKGQLDRANSLITVEETLGQTFVGAPVGSALFAVAIGLPFLFNAAGFVIAVVLISAVRGSYRPPRDEASTSIRTDIAVGVRWLRRHALLRGLTLISATTACAQTMASGLLVLYALEVLHLPPGRFGFLLMAAGVGAVIGGLATPPLTRVLGRAIMLPAGSVLAALALGGMSMTRNGYIAGTFFALSSAGIMVWNVLTMSLRQSLIPEALFGRVQGAYRTLVWGSMPLGALLGGVLAGSIGIRGVFAVVGAVQFLMALVLGGLTSRHRDAMRDQPTATHGAEAPAPDAATTRR